MKKGIHQYRNLERGAIDIALIMSFVVFLLSLSAAFFYFSFSKNSPAVIPLVQTETQQEEQIPAAITATSTQEKELIATSSPSKVKESSIPVFIGSYGNIKKEYLEGIQTAIKKSTGAQVTILGSAAEVVKKSPLYDEKRQQFDADVLLKGVETASLQYDKKSRFIFVFDVDLYSSSIPSLKSVWYAGTKGKKVSIVSLFGLQKKSETDIAQALSSTVISRLQKNSLHVIGVNIGISPSSDPACIMYPAKTLAELDKQGTEYCSSEQTAINSAFAQ